MIKGACCSCSDAHRYHFRHAGSTRQICEAWPAPERIGPVHGQFARRPVALGTR